MAGQGIESHSTFHLERDMERYVTMDAQDLLRQVEAAEFILEHSQIERQVNLARRVIAHIEFEVSQRMGNGFRAETTLASGDTD